MELADQPDQQAVELNEADLQKSDMARLRDDAE
jgi:hypothetical protein